MVVVVPYVDAVVAVIVMRGLLFVLHVCMLRECEAARVTEMPGCFDTICTAVYIPCDSYTACRLCRLEPRMCVSLFSVFISSIPRGCMRSHSTTGSLQSLMVMFLRPIECV